MGIGRPVTGKMPVTTAAFTNAYNTKLNAMPMDKKIPNGSVHSFAIFIPRKKISRNKLKSNHSEIQNVETLIKEGKHLLAEKKSPQILRQVPPTVL